ncbi:MAG: uracil-DNA glycosylase [Campylobacterales bacterium]|nr:uracil-DNA glycosylase [Campylobacterales bacterium]
MKSYQNIVLLQNLYRLKAIGFEYIDPFSINEANELTKAQTLSELELTIRNCHLCDLSKSRTQSMSGYGNENADVLIIDFSVSQVQDTTNNYYAGRAGETLKNMIINVLEYQLEDIYITHCVKCKPLNANLPSLSEFNSCSSYINSQIEFIKPKVIVTLGEHAYVHLTKDANNFENVRGHLIDFKGYKLVPIYHPTHLLKNPELKKRALADLKTIKKLCN